MSQTIRRVEQKTAAYSFDGVKWFFVLLFILAGVLVNFNFINQPTWQLVLENVLLVFVVVGIFSITTKGKRFWAFAKEAKIEMHKIIWSSRKETFQSALMVMVVVLIAAVFLWCIDNILLWVLNFFATQRG